MHFVRVAGCTVGKHPGTDSVAYEMGDGKFPILKTNNPAWLCHTYDGRPFWCDTDFGLRERLSIQDLLNDTWEHHICLTGGEPLNYDLTEFILRASHKGIAVHIETSGTVDWTTSVVPAWITVSPKQGVLDSMIMRANEVKLLVDAEWSIDKVPPSIMEHPLVWIQPINDELDVDFNNVRRCLDVLKEMPKWRLSVQVHKLIKVR